MSTKGAIGWTPEREERLRELWDGGYSASVVSEMMGGGWLTRNAVIGKARRMELARRRTVIAKNSRRGKDKRTRQAKRPAKQPLVSLPVDARTLKADAWAALPHTTPVSLTDLDHGMCKWPIGDGKPFMFCGAAAVGSYCEHHKAMSVGIGTASERAASRVSLKVAA